MKFCDVLAGSLRGSRMPPVGFKRSRALWDLSREENTQKGLWRAILYELQPTRNSEWRGYTDNATLHARGMVQALVVWTTTTVPWMARFTFQFVKGMSLGQWKMVAIAFAYYVFVRWVHAVIDAGPLVLIISALVAIFTIGLSDNGSDGLSAYSVFNMGFQKLLGSVDADALLQQHVGGAAGMMGFAGGMPPRDERREFDNNRHQHDDNADDAREDFGNANANPRNEQQLVGAGNDIPQRARRSGKKARRDANAIAQRRDQRAQREAAAALGFGGNGHRADDAAVLRLLDDQDVALP